MYGQKKEERKKKKPSADDQSGHASKIQIIDIVEIRTQTSASALPLPPEAQSTCRQQRLRAEHQTSCHSNYGHK